MKVELNIWLDMKGGDRTGIKERFDAVPERDLQELSWP